MLPYIRLVHIVFGVISIIVFQKKFFGNKLEEPIIINDDNDAEKEAEDLSNVSASSADI